ncbi:MAG: carbohydrate binding family 9 domain-containing protein, partial [Gemmatimonadaceae bacterium]
MTLPARAVVLAAAFFATRLSAQSVAPAADTTSSATSAPSAAGATSARALRAHQVERAVVVDGRLDEPEWQAAQVAGNFVQSEPRSGEAATEATEVRVLYDAERLYIGAYLHDRAPADIVVNDIRKDFNPDQQDDFEVILDTFHDRRNGYVFITNVAGARADRQVANEGREINTSWDAVWTVKTQRVNDGWVVEMAIPFRTLRFDFARAENWGINFSRRIRRRNEVSFWAPVPRAYTLARVSL